MPTIPITDAQFLTDIVAVWKKREDNRNQRCDICGKTENEGGCSDTAHLAHAIALAEEIHSGSAQSVPFSVDDLLAEIVADAENASPGTLVGEILVALGENILLHSDYEQNRVFCIFCREGITLAEWEDETATIQHLPWCLTQDALRAIHRVLDIAEGHLIAGIPLSDFDRDIATSMLRHIIYAVHGGALLFYDTPSQCLACVCCDENVSLTTDMFITRQDTRFEHKAWCLAVDAERVIRKLSLM